MGSGQSAPTVPSAPSMPSPTSMTTSSLSPSIIAPPSSSKCSNPVYPFESGNRCFRKCPDGSYNYTDACFPNGIPTQGFSRGAGSPLITTPTCPPGKVNEHNLCYTPCPSGMNGVGNNCTPDFSKVKAIDWERK